jgi:hypothetical protein
MSTLAATVIRRSFMRDGMIERSKSEADTMFSCQAPCCT